MTRKKFSQIAMAVVISLNASWICAQTYDPLNKTNEKTTAPRDLTIKASGQDREIPIRVYLPAQTESVPVILFSHGLGGSRRACSYLGKHWSARGYVAVFMQHPGSDEAIWKDLPIRDRMRAMKQSASAQNLFARFEDVKAVLDQLSRWNQAKDHRFFERFDMDRVGMSGHSFGAATTQGVGGQWNPLLGHRYTDKRIDAAIMFSPNRPRRPEPKMAFGKVAIPWLLMTGTKDTVSISDTTVDDRRQVYPALPKTIDKYELVLHDGEHHAFAEGRQRNNQNPNHHRVILALSTAFWDAHLREDQAAKKWLHGDAPQQIMEPKDQWQKSIADKKG